MPKRGYRLYYQGTEASSTQSTASSTKPKSAKTTKHSHKPEQGENTIVVLDWSSTTTQTTKRHALVADFMSTPFGSLGWFIDIDDPFPFPRTSSPQSLPTTDPSSQWSYNMFLGGYVLYHPTHGLLVYDYGDVVKVMEWEAERGWYEVLVLPWQQNQYNDHPDIVLRAGM